MKKTGKIIMITGTLIFMILLAGCGGVKTDNNFLVLSHVTPEDGGVNTPLHAIFSWKINTLRDDELTYVIHFFNDTEEIESENIGVKDDYFYYQPEGPFSPNTEYQWQIEAYQNEILMGTSKIYSFKTQSISKFDISFIFYNEENDYEQNIWMAVPKVWNGSKNTLQVDNISFTPASATEYTDETGNKIVRWDTIQTPASSYSVNASIEIVNHQYLPNLDEKVVFEYDEEKQIYQENIQPSEFIQSDHPEIISKAKEIVGAETNPYKKVLLLNDWIGQNISYGPGQHDALGVLRNKVTDCAGFSALNVAFCRALGIPTRFIAGIGDCDFKTGIYYWNVEEAGFGTHCWYEVYFEKYGWFQFEGTINDNPFIRDTRIVLSKSPVSINEQDISWLHIPYAGKLNEYEYQAESFPYTFLLEVH